MNKNSTLTESKLPKKNVKKQAQAIEIFKLYDDIRDQIIEIEIATGERKIYRTNTASIKNSKINLDRIFSTQDFPINKRLA